MTNSNKDFLDVKNISFKDTNFWLILLFFSLFIMGTALFYQYDLGYEPCVLCVHIRAWIIALGAISCVALLIPHDFVRTPSFLIGAALLLFLSLDVFELWQIEAGYKMGSCSWSAGFPEFMPLNEWAPLLFEIGGICGESPDMLFGISMAEYLMAFLVGLIVFFGLSLVIAIRRKFLKLTEAH